ncbi:hypothetical protein ITP53_20305 [Nonomuraea sp. K274]|uniref:Uncharacterized protein n=1 Tax=Nonomuraea cypriaca TaxID=1187855 RepID=A0A931A809_9ACTN|nr:hypothetical protein [Nonomuraea cypriaca]MBF8188036.1 hypothetical protein [Nonomuraea cypriaca]
MTRNSVRDGREHAPVHSGAIPQRGKYRGARLISLAIAEAPGDVPPLTREVLRQAEPDLERRRMSTSADRATVFFA